MRLDQRNFTQNQQRIYKQAIQALDQSGEYQKLLALHQAPGYNRHGAEGMAGLYRFLGWHRRFLLLFEERFLAAQATLGVPANQRIQLPYLRWVDPFPAWADAFTTTLDPASPNSNRNKNPATLLPSAADLTEIMTNSRAQLPTEPAPINDYVRFTYALEGWGERTNGTTLPGHNHIHAWVNGIMDMVADSPADPVFWLLHSEVDRLWHIWQQTNPNQAPPFDPGDEVMKPWDDTYNQLTNINTLGYDYESLVYI